MLAWDSCPPSCWHHVVWFLPGRHSSRISADRASVAHGAHLSLKPLSGLSTCTFTESNVSSYWCLWPWGVDRAHCSLPYLSICIFSFQQWEVCFFFLFLFFFCCLHTLNFILCCWKMPDSYLIIIILLNSCFPWEVAGATCCLPPLCPVSVNPEPLVCCLLHNVPSRECHKNGK